MLLRVLISCAVVAVAAPAFAQGTSQGPERNAAVRDGARLRLGPFYFNPSLNIDNIGIDDNVFLDPETGEPRSDFGFSMTPRLGTQLPLASRALLSFNVAPQVQYYQEYKEAQSVFHNVSSRADLFLGRVGAFGTAAVRIGRQRPNNEIDTRPSHRRVSFEGGLGYTPLPKLTFEAAAFRNTTAFDADEAFGGTRLKDTLDEETDGVRAAIRQDLTPKTSVQVQATSARTRFAFSPIRDSQTYRVAPGVKFALTALISGSAHVGYMWFEPENAALPAFSGVSADLDLSYTLLEATRFTVTWSRDLAYSYEARQPYYVVNGLGGRIRRQIAGRVDAILAYTQSESSYTAIAPLESDVQRLDITRVYSADLGARLTRRSRVGLRYTQSDRRSNDQRSRDYDRRQIGLSYMYGM